MATHSSSPPTTKSIADLESNGEYESSSTHGSTVKHDSLIPDQSRGTLQMERLKDRLSTKYRILLYGSFALLAYVMSLNQYTSSSFLTAATSYSFNAHSTLATISSIKSVFQAVSQPPIAKISDTFGRIEAYALCVVLYAIGYIIVSSASSIYAYAVGNSINILGITGLFLLQNIIIADCSSLKNRLFWSIFPSIPGTINVWVSGNIAQSLLGDKSQHASMWRWGFGMFTILVPVLAIPIMLTLGIGMRKSKSDVKTHVVPRAADGSAPSLWQKTVSVFWSLDVIGLLLMVAGFGMVLCTVTIANGKGSKWSDAHCIALLVVGGVCIIGFVFWEALGARHPLIPFGLLKNRTVIVCFIIDVIHPMAGGVIGSYFYTYLLVAAGETTLSATRITSIASFTGTWTALVMGLVARQIRYLKPIIIFGFCLELLAFGLMVRYRGQTTHSQGDLAGVQFLRGVGSGCISFPVQAAIQSVAKHEHLAAITASSLTIFYLAGGVGSAIGGGIWTNLVPKKMAQYVVEAGGNSTIAGKAYSSPLGLLTTYPLGTPIRTAMAHAQGDTQRVLSITGLCLASIGLIAALFLQNVRLTDEVTLEAVEKSEAGKIANVEKAN